MAGVTRCQRSWRWQRVARLSGARSLYAIAQWGRLQPPDVVGALGVTRMRTPAVRTLHYPFKALDVDAFEAAWQR